MHWIVSNFYGSLHHVKACFGKETLRNWKNPRGLQSCKSGILVEDAESLGDYILVPVEVYIRRPIPMGKVRVYTSIQKSVAALGRYTATNSEK